MCTCLSYDGMMKTSKYVDLVQKNCFDVKQEANKNSLVHYATYKISAFHFHTIVHRNVSVQVSQSADPFLTALTTSCSDHTDDVS